MAVAVYSAFSHSGGHLNPAITVGLYTIAEGNLTGRIASAYVLAQTLGCLLGALLLRFALPATAVEVNPFVTQGVLSEGVSRNLAGLGIFEFMLTFT